MEAATATATATAMGMGMGMATVEVETHARHRDTVMAAAEDALMHARTVRVYAYVQCARAPDPATREPESVPFATSAQAQSSVAGSGSVTFPAAG